MALTPGFETTDLGSAGFALSRGLSIRKVDREGPEGRSIRYVFDDPDGIGPRLALEYANSAERKHDECVRTLKRLAYGGREQTRAPGPNRQRR